MRSSTSFQPVDWDWAAYATELRVPGERLATGRKLAELVEEYATQHELPWTLQFRKGYVACLRPGGYRVAIVDLYWKSAPRFAVRLPDTPEAFRSKVPTRSYATRGTRPRTCGDGPCPLSRRSQTWPSHLRR
jgi:hypothetical protein